MTLEILDYLFYIEYYESCIKTNIICIQCLKKYVTKEPFIKSILLIYFYTSVLPNNKSRLSEKILLLWKL